MKVNEKLHSIITNSYGIITVFLLLCYHLKIGNTDLIMFFLGIIQILIGLNEIKLSKQSDFKGNRKWKKIAGLLSLGLGSIVLILEICLLVMNLFNIY